MSPEEFEQGHSDDLAAARFTLSTPEAQGPLDAEVAASLVSRLAAAR